MNTLHQQLYPYFFEEAVLTALHAARRLYALLRRTARATRLEIISGVLFLSVITVYVLTLHMRDIYVLLSGAGCIMASLALLFTDHHPMRKLQALGSMIGNALIISIF